MTDAPELRGPLSEGLHRLADEVRLGLHDDPHIGFAVLVYPDREPAVFAVMEDFAYDLIGLRTPKDGVDGKAFPMAEFDQARMAMDDASLGFLIGQHGGILGQQEVGDCIAERISEQWDRRKMQPLEHALALATYEAENPVLCPTCQRRFRTERGLKMHQSRTRAMRCKVEA